MTTPWTGPAGPPPGRGRGSDDAGLICGYLFERTSDGTAQALDADGAAAWLAARTASSSGFAWLHFNLNHAQAERWLVRHAGLSDTFYETLKDGSHSTRIERDDDALIAVVNDVHFDFGFEPSDIATLWISVGPHLVVTARIQPLRTVDALRTAVRAGESPRSSVALLETLMRTQADGLVGIVRGVTTRIDRVEDELLSGRLDHKRARLGVLRRLLVRLQRLLAPEPAALFRLLQHPPAWMAEEDVQELHAAIEEQIRLQNPEAARQAVRKLLADTDAMIQRN